MSAQYQALINRYFQDVGGSPLYNVNTQYYDIVDGVQRFIVNRSTVGGVFVDSRPFPPGGCPPYKTAGTGASVPVCLTDLQIQDEVLSAVTANGWTPTPNSTFFVFPPKNVGTCFGSDCAFVLAGQRSGFCAYHDFFTINSVNYIYANMPYTGTDLVTCGVDTSPNNDFDADSTINVTSHEHQESVTDPVFTGFSASSVGGWWDINGEENGDKCAWTFGTVGGDGSNVSWNGHSYIVQQEWSNADAGCVLTYGNVGPTPTPSVTSTTTSTPSPTSTATTTNTPTITNTPPLTGTSTATTTASVTGTPTITSTVSDTPTATNTAIGTPTRTATATRPPTNTPKGGHR